jgi:phosphopantothenoylcysteine decarboxylase/phosphopantothenate--cysteine ligase
VETAAQLESALDEEYDDCDVLLMAAAVADYKVSDALPTGKLERKEKTDLQLVQTSDIVSSLEGNGKARLKVGFSAEYGEGNLDRARGKMRDKGLGMIVFNDISRSDIGFEADQNEVTIMVPGREDVFVEKTSKRECAERILDQVKNLIGRQT